MNTLDSLELEPFSPPKSLHHPLVQTIVPYYLPTGPQLHYHREFIELPDGDRLAIAISKPQEWKKSQRVVVLFHGLAGCEESSYLLRIGRKLFEAQFLVIRVNLRSCGPGRGLAQKPYHSGRSEDARAVINWVEKKFPGSPITQVGFSLSGNFTLKMLGEDDSLISSALDSALSISPPLDLGRSAVKLTQKNLKIFNHFFLRRLKRHVGEIQADFPQLPRLTWPKKMDLIDFDHIYTAPRSGFKDAFDYYEKSSSLPFVPKIKRPTLILLSLDDPVVETKGLNINGLPSHIETIQTLRGGHVGFLEKNRFWMDEVVLRWIKRQDRNVN